MATFTTTKGMTVESNLSSDEVFGILRTNPKVGDFGKDLAAKAARWGLSNDQMAWAHKLAMEVITPVTSQTASAGLDVRGIAGMFKKASGGLKHPKIRFNWNGTDLQLSMAGLRCPIIS